MIRDRGVGDEEEFLACQNFHHPGNFSHQVKQSNWNGTSSSSSPVQSYESLMGSGGDDEFNLCDENCPDYEHEHQIEIPPNSHQNPAINHSAAAAPLYYTQSVNSPYILPADYSNGYSHSQSIRSFPSFSSTQYSSSSPNYSDYLSESRSMDSFDSQPNREHEFANFYKNPDNSEIPEEAKNSAVRPLGPTLNNHNGHQYNTLSVNSPQPSCQYRVAQIAETPSPALSLRSAASSRTSLTSSTGSSFSHSPAPETQTMDGRTFAATETNLVPGVSVNAPNDYLANNNLPPHWPHARSVSQPVSPARSILPARTTKKNFKSPPIFNSPNQTISTQARPMIEPEQFVPVPALTIQTGINYHQQQNPSQLSVGIPSPLDIPIPAVDLSGKNVLTPLSAGMKKRRRDSLIHSANEIKSMASMLTASLRRTSMTETNLTSSEKHFTFSPPKLSNGTTSYLQQSPSFGSTRASPPLLPHRRPSLASTVSDDGNSVNSFSLPALALSSVLNIADNTKMPARRASVHQMSGSTSGKSSLVTNQIRPKRRKSVAEFSPAASTVSFPASDKALSALTSMVKLEDSLAKLMVVKGVDYLHDHDRSVKAKEKLIGKSQPESMNFSLPLHVKVRDYLRSKFVDENNPANINWIEPSITHILWIYERGWTDYNANCPPNIHTFTMENSRQEIFPAPIVTTTAPSGFTLPQISTLTIESSF